jgi:glycosyltransferase involved in cell wall biosynthesis
MEEMKVSVIVPSYNGAEKLPLLMAALSAQSVMPSEIIVVLDGSTDESKQVLENWSNRLPLRIFEQENRGRAGARNRGAAEASGNFFVFYDDDMAPEPHSLFLHIEILSKHEDCICGGQQEELTIANNEFSEYKKYMTELWVQDFGTAPLSLNEKSLFLTAANMSISRKAFELLNGFDQTLRDSEDYDLAVRAFAAGVTVVFDPMNFAYHTSFLTIRAYIIRQREYRSSVDSLLRIRSTEDFSSLYQKQRVKISIIKKAIYFFVPVFAISLIDNQFFTFLKREIRFSFYQRVVSAFSIYYPQREL